MIDPSLPLRFALDSSCACDPLSGIGKKPLGNALAPGKDSSQRARILDGLSRALRKIGSHWVSGVADEHDAPQRKGRKRSPHIYRPRSPNACGGEKIASGLRPTLESPIERLSVCGAVPGTIICRSPPNRFDHGNNIENGFGAQKIMHQMRIRTNAQANLPAPPTRIDEAHVDRCAKGDSACTQ